MTSQPLRLTTPGELPAPRVDSDSAFVLTDALDTPARLRTPYWLGDSAVNLHALASLIAQPQKHAARGRRRRPRPGPQLARNRTAPRPLSSRRRPEISKPLMIHLTTITHIMAEHPLYGRHVRPSAHREARRRVPQFVRCQPGLADRDGCPVEPRPARVAVTHHATIGRREHEVIAGFPGKVTHQVVGEEPRQRNRASPVRFRRAPHRVPRRRPR